MKNISPIDQNFPIYCINLKRETRRRERLSERAKELKLSINFIEGATPQSDETIELMKGYRSQRRLKIYNQDLTLAEHACFASHLKVLKTFLKSPHEHCIILEDNVALFDNFPNALNEIYGKAIEFDVLRLETRKKCKIDFPFMRLEKFDLRFTPCATLGASALLFSRAGAKSIIKSSQNYIYAYDTHIGYFWRHNLKTLCISPHIAQRAENKAVPSVIDAVDAEQSQARQAQKQNNNFGQKINRRIERTKHSFMKYFTAAYWALQASFKSRTPR